MRSVDTALLPSRTGCVKIEDLSTATDPRSRSIFDNLELQLALYLSFEPTIADLIARPLSISNATLHEFILMRLKEVTLVFSKTLEKILEKKLLG